MSPPPKRSRIAQGALGVRDDSLRVREVVHHIPPPSHAPEQPILEHPRTRVRQGLLGPKQHAQFGSGEALRILPEQGKDALACGAAGGEGRDATRG